MKCHLKTAAGMLALGLFFALAAIGPFSAPSFSRAAETGRQTRQFNSAEASEAYQAATNCLEEKGYSEGDTRYSAKYSACLARVQEITDGIGKENNQCLSQCATNKPGSSNCDICVEHYSAGGFTERTFSACDSFCVDKSPGQCGQCYDRRDQKKNEVSGAVDAAIADWQAAHPAVAPESQTKPEGVRPDGKKQQPADVKTPPAPKQTPAKPSSAPAAPPDKPAAAPPLKAPDYAAIAPAKFILSKPDRIELSGTQSTGANTSALKNIKDVAAGKCAESGKRACQYLSPKLLQTMVAISKDFRYSVSALVGGEHCKNAGQKGCKGVSNHYAGQAFDVNYVYDDHGRKAHVAPQDGNSYNFMKKCLQAGFTDVIGPRPLPPGAKNNKQHDNHIHCGFK